MKTSSSILITGGAGFIGSHTVNLLLKKNKAVTVLDNLSTGKLSNLDLKSPLLRFVEGDVTHYSALLEEVKQCESILHLAALPSVPQSIEDPIGTQAVNMNGFLHVLQAIREVSRPIRLVYASSAAVYGNSPLLPCCDETFLKYPVLSPYALQKIQDEQYADLYARLFNIPSLALRYFNVYGEGQDPQSVYSGVISRFLSRYQQKEKITLFGDGEQSRDFIHVSDVARANVLALECEYNGVLNIATGKAETLRNLVSYIEEKNKGKIEVEMKAPRPGDIRTSYAAIIKAKQYLHFQSEISLKTGIGQLC